MIRALRTCPTCGLEVPADAPEGACPGCLLASGLDSLLNGDKETPGETESQQDASTERVGVLAGEFGDYHLLHEIGRGGQGIVYLARQKSLNRTVALKILRVGQWASRADVKRFRREAAAAASLDHARIVPIYEVGERDGSCYFSMKFVEGGQLDEVVSRAPMSMRQAAEVIAKVARTVHYAHQHGILHRDIKPGNILLDTDGEPHLTDFGLARLVEAESTVTQTELIMGTPSYMAPEQAIGHVTQLTSTTDVYGVGAVLYQLLTSHPPFAAETTYETIRLLVETDPREPRLLNSKIDRELSTICLKCLEKDPKRRYPSALALAEDLEHWLKHEPIEAKRSGFVSHAHKWMQRNPAIAALVVSLVALAAAVGWNIWKSDLFLSAPEKSIAVLPFSNLSNQAENAFFADGVQEEILTRLSRIADLRVIGRTSAMQYKAGAARNLRKIGQELGVAHVLEGTVQRAGNRLRVNAQLVDTRTGTVGWAEQYDRDLNDLFAVQSDIAQKVARQLQTEISTAEKLAIERPSTIDLTAFDLYTRAENLLLSSFSSTAKVKLFQAVDLLDEAVARDPSFLQAYCRLAFTHDRLYFLGLDHTPKRLVLAEAAIEAASHLRPDAGEVHLALAENLYQGYLDYDGALAELQLARRSLPNHPRIFELKGYIERRRGRWEESTRTLERAIELDPGNFFILQQIALSYGMLHRYPDETSVLERALAVEADDVNTKVALATVQFHWKANTEPLHQTIDSIRATNPSALPDVASDWLSCALAERDLAAAKNALDAFGDTPLTDYSVHLNRSLLEGVLARMAHDDDRARSAFATARAEQKKIVQAQPEYGPALCVLGLIDAALGRKDDALREGQRALELTPVEKEAISGPLMIHYLAVIAAWAGNKDLACQQLAIAVRPPSTVSYGQLKLLPWWDPLRGDPRFEQIVASLAPGAARESAGHESRSALRRSDAPR
jgi:serine/threonine protein kinase/Flp pilus assembly protein TadD